MMNVTRMNPTKSCRRRCFLGWSLKTSMCMMLIMMVMLPMNVSKMLHDVVYMIEYSSSAH